MNISARHTFICQSVGVAVKWLKTIYDLNTQGATPAERPSKPKLANWAAVMRSCRGPGPERHTPQQPKSRRAHMVTNTSWGSERESSGNEKQLESLKACWFHVHWAGRPHELKWGLVCLQLWSARPLIYVQPVQTVSILQMFITFLRFFLQFFVSLLLEINL